MPQTVNPGKRYPTGYPDITVTNTTGAAFHVCDCCENRRRFSTLAAAEAHETGNAPAPWQAHGPDGSSNDRV